MEFIKNIISSFNKENIGVLKRSFIDPSVYIDAIQKSEEDLMSYLNFSISICFFIAVISNITYNMNHIKDSSVVEIVIFWVVFTVSFYPVSLMHIWINALFLSWFGNKHVKSNSFEQIKNLAIISLIPCTIIGILVTEILNIINTNAFLQLILSFIVYIVFVNIMLLMKCHKNNSIEGL